MLSERRFEFMVMVEASGESSPLWGRNRLEWDVNKDQRAIALHICIRILLLIERWMVEGFQLQDYILCCDAAKLHTEHSVLAASHRKGAGGEEGKRSFAGEINFFHLKQHPSVADVTYLADLLCFPRIYYAKWISLKARNCACIDQVITFSSSWETQGKPHKPGVEGKCVSGPCCPTSAYLFRCGIVEGCICTV